MNARRTELEQQQRDLAARMEAVEDELEDLRNIDGRMVPVVESFDLGGDSRYKARVLADYGFDPDEAEKLLRKLTAK